VLNALVCLCSLLLAPFGTVGERRLIELNDPAGYDAAMPKMEGVLKRAFLGTPAGTWLDFQPQLSRISFVGNASTTPGVPGELPGLYIYALQLELKSGCSRLGRASGGCGIP
jgi:hypothetical protein